MKPRTPEVTSVRWSRVVRTPEKPGLLKSADWIPVQPVMLEQVGMVKALPEEPRMGTASGQSQVWSPLVPVWGGCRSVVYIYDLKRLEGRSSQKTQQFLEVWEVPLPWRVKVWLVIL